MKLAIDLKEVGQDDILTLISEWANERAYHMAITGEICKKETPDKVGEITTELMNLLEREL